MGGVLARAVSLTAALVLCAATAAAAPAASCPERHDVEQEIDRLGAASALALKGTTDVSVDGGGMRIVLRGRDGKVLGAREVAAPEACQERAVVAAVVIAAWLGEWSAGEPRAAAPPGPARRRRWWRSRWPHLARAGRPVASISPGSDRSFTMATSAPGMRAARSPWAWVTASR